MKFETKDPPRTFEVGLGHKAVISDCGALRLEADEQITFTTEGRGELDVTRKDWGFYATPSLNGRLARFDLRAVLVVNRLGHIFTLLVERGHEASFEHYMAIEQLNIVHWLDTEEQVAGFLDKLGVSRPAADSL